MVKTRMVTFQWSMIERVPTILVVSRSKGTAYALMNSFCRTNNVTGFPPDFIATHPGARTRQTTTATCINATNLTHGDRNLVANNRQYGVAVFVHVTPEDAFKVRSFVRGNMDWIAMIDTVNTVDFVRTWGFMPPFRARSMTYVRDPASVGKKHRPFWTYEIPRSMLMGDSASKSPSRGSRPLPSITVKKPSRPPMSAQNKARHAIKFVKRYRRQKGITSPRIVWR